MGGDAGGVGGGAADLHEELSHQLQRLRQTERARVRVRRRMSHHVEAGLDRERRRGRVAVADRAAHLLAPARVHVLWMRRGCEVRRMLLLCRPEGTRRRGRRGRTIAERCESSWCAPRASRRSCSTRVCSSSHRASSPIRVERRARTASILAPRGWLAPREDSQRRSWSWSRALHSWPDVSSLSRINSTCTHIWEWGACGWHDVGRAVGGLARSTHLRLDQMRAQRRDVERAELLALNLQRLVEVAVGALERVALGAVLGAEVLRLPVVVPAEDREEERV